MQTSLWGEKSWIFLNAIAANAPEHIPRARRKLYKSFFVDNLKELLPCIHCRHSFVEYSDELPIEAFWDTRGGVLTWLYLIHSKVNKKLSKPDISFLDYIKKVESMRAKCSKTGAKGCTEPHIEKNAIACRSFADEIWNRYGNVDIYNWRKSQIINRMFIWICYALIAFVICHYIIPKAIKLVIQNRNSRIIKIMS